MSPSVAPDGREGSRERGHARWLLTGSKSLEITWKEKQGGTAELNEEDWREDGRREGGTWDETGVGKKKKGYRLGFKHINKKEREEGKEIR